jgi:hypothetical protein
MLFIIGILLVLLFFGLGFTAKVLWWGILLGLVLIVAEAVSGRRL